MPVGTVDTTIALITLADAKAFLKVATGTTSEDAIIADLINECSVWINSYCNRKFIDVGTNVTEYYDGDGTPQLHLRQWPVLSVTSLYADSARAWGADTAIDVTADVQIDNEAGILTLWNGQSSFGRGTGNIKVLYRAGYTYNSNVPYDLQLACRKQVAWKYFQDYSQRRYGVSSETTGERTVSYSNDALLPDVKQILNRYRRITI
jgi:uncharacterized phiE125 gp8 family phage protein